MEQVIAYVATAGLAWLVGKIGSAIKYAKIGGTVVDMIYELRKSASDGKLTEEEVKNISAKYSDVVKAYKANKK